MHIKLRFIGLTGSGDGDHVFLQCSCHGFDTRLVHDGTGKKTVDV